MAAPTDVRAEAVSPNDTRIYWTYAGSFLIGVYRSTDGVSYSLVGFNTAVSTAQFSDSGLAGNTKYWYKVSDDGGSTFSSVVTVWTHLCFLAPGSGIDLTLARSPVSPDQFDNTMDQLEGVLNNQLLSPTPCDVCVSDGRVVLDCSSGCSEFYVDVTADVNSITIIHCADGAGTQGPGATIHWRVPPSTTRKICGWPQGQGFGGDECFRLAVAGGTSGRTVSTGVGGSSKQSSTTGQKGPGGNPGSASGSGGGGGGGGTGGGCVCTPGRNNTLAIKSCTSDNSLSCSSTKALVLLACGGVGPYTWSNTGSVSLSKTTGGSTRVSPPTNNGSGEAGTAYVKTVEGIPTGHSVGTIHSVGGTYANYGCNDNFVNCPGVTPPGITAGTCVFAGTDCGTHTGHELSGETYCGPTATCTKTCTNDPIDCDCTKANGAVSDVRTAGMIAAGCVPCGLSEGDTVSVTDAQGTVVTIILKA